MFIGHLAGAELLHVVFPQTPAWVSLVGIGFPDFLWGATIVAGIERAEMGTSPLMRDVTFTHYPYSHSLALTNLIALVPALALVPFYGWQAAVVFVLASASHWLLDVLVHRRDLPVLGFGRDTKVGLGLWRNGPLAFAVEFLVVVAATLAFTPPEKWLLILGLAALFHAANSNGFFAFTKTNPMSAKAFAVLGVVGFSALAIVYSFIL